MLGLHGPGPRQVQQHRARPVQQDRPRVRLRGGGGGARQLPVSPGPGEVISTLSNNTYILISTLSTHPRPGDRVCAHYLGGEDRRVPDVPEPGQSGGQHHLQQVQRDERHDPRRRGVRGGAGARAVHDHGVRHEAGDQTCQPRAPQPAHILKYLYGTKQLTITTTQLLTTYIYNYVLNFNL